MADEVLRIVVDVDGVARLSNGVKVGATEVRGLGKELDEGSKQAKKHSEEVHGAANAMEHLNLNSVAARRELMVLAHELSQGNYKKFGGSMMVLAEQTDATRLIFSATGIAALGLVAGIGAIGYAVLKGAEQQHAFNNALIATGNFAAISSDQFNDMAGRIAASAHEGIGGARETMQSLVASGRFTQTSLFEVGQAAQLMAKYTGQSADDVVKHFAKMGDGVADWAYEANRNYHFLTLEQYKHIKALEDQGREQEAMAVTAAALTGHLKAQETQLGYLAKAWDIAKSSASAAWDAMLGVWRGKTSGDKLGDINSQIALLEYQSKVRPVGGVALDDRNKVLADLKAQRDALQQQIYQEGEAAAINSSAAESNAAGIKKQREEDRKGKGNVHKPAEDHSAANYLDQLKRQYRALSGEGSVYATTLEHLATNAAKFNFEQYQTAAALALSIDAQKNKKIVDDAELKYLEQSAVLHEKGREDWVAEQEAMRQASRDREFEISLIGKTTQEMARLTMARDVERQRFEARGKVLARMASGATDGVQGGLELEAVNEDHKNKLLQRNLLLADQFKPGWRKLIDGWGDTMQMMRDAHDSAMQGVVRTGEEAWVELGMTGQLNAKKMMDGILQEYLRMTYRQNIAKPLAGLADGVFGKLFAGNPASGLPTEGKALSNFASFLGMHTGGVVGREATFSRMADPVVFAGAPRFHTGGVAGNEVPIIAKRGEGIFTPEQMKALAPAGGGGGGGAGGGTAPSVTVNVVTPPGYTGQVTQKQNGDGLSLDVLVTKIEDVLADRAANGQGNLIAAVGQRYGMRPALA